MELYKEFRDTITNKWKRISACALFAILSMGNPVYGQESSNIEPGWAIDMRDPNIKLNYPSLIKSEEIITKVSDSLNNRLTSVTRKWKYIVFHDEYLTQILFEKEPWLPIDYLLSYNIITKQPTILIVGRKTKSSDPIYEEVLEDAIKAWNLWKVKDLHNISFDIKFANLQDYEIKIILPSEYEKVCKSYLLNTLFNTL